ncbi:MAG TPA: hypothetical protein PLW75_03965 [Hyphomicrobium sp.]|nr:hypothetical protein [Hyphomicrobium sp.]
MMDYTAQNLTRFFAALDPIKDVYADPEFVFILHISPAAVSLLNARLMLQPISTDHPEKLIETGNFYGFSGRLKSLGVTPRELVLLLLDGYVPGPDRVWVLTRDEQRQVSPGLYHQRQSSSEGLQQKIHELVGFGLSVPYSPVEDDDWSLRASGTPFSHLNDLMAELGLPRSHHQFHMMAFPPLLVDVTSRVRGEIAELRLLRSSRLSADQTALGVISANQGVKERKSFPGDQLKWKKSDWSDDVLVGSLEIPVSKASVVHCLAVVNQQCLHHYWVHDPDAGPNLVRTIYELFDPQCEDAISMLAQPATKGQATAQENAVSALLWMLGYSPLHLGGRLSEAPDVIAISSDGHLVVVECTLSDLQTKKQNKPQKLIDRTNKIRSALERSNAARRVCIPVLVTARKRADIEEDVVDCERKGIVVYTLEDVEPIINATIAPPHSEDRFQELKERLDEAVSRYELKQRKEREMARTVEDIKKVLNRDR